MATTPQAENGVGDPKELLIITGANHVDLYDKTDVIPFDRLGDFFGRHLVA